MKIAFIGAGVMAEAIISSLLKKDTARPGDITASDVVQMRLAELQSRYGIECVRENAEAIKGKDVVILSVKPQAFPAVADGLRGKLRDDQLVLSIMAGVRMDSLKLGLAHHRLVRVMPNTPAQIGEGISVWTATGAVRENQKETARTVLSALGKEIYVEDEKYIDMATAVSGSGPAYVFLIIEAFTDAAVHIGLPRPMASQLVLQTVLGSARFAEASGKHPAELKGMVTSPGGTTAEGLLRLEKGKLRAAFTQAVIAAYEKAQSLGKEPR